MKIQFKSSYLKNGIKFLLFLTVTLCFLIYLPCDIYNFETPKKFSGNYLYNPYEDSFANWQKTNFHAHAVAWDGITNGKQQAQKILDAYKQKGYAYACISNYEHIAKEDEQPNSIDVYEHGCNIFKTHQLAIMPQQVCYRDFPLFQFASSKQFVINNLSAASKAVVLAHPRVRNGYSNKDLKKLTGYNLMEVLNHAGNAGSKWDVALSSGKPVWIVGDDDTHNILDSNQTFANWTMIDSKQNDKDSLINSLVSGKAYAVNGKNAFNDNNLENVKVNGMYFSIQLQNKADSIKLIGQNGTWTKAFFNTDKAGYTFNDSDTYMRTIVYNKASTMYLNPVIRYDGKAKPQNILTASINSFDTVLYRYSLLLCWLILFRYFNRTSIKRVVELLKQKLPQKRRSPSFLTE